MSYEGGSNVQHDKGHCRLRPGAISPTSLHARRNPLDNPPPGFRAPTQEEATPLSLALMCRPRFGPRDDAALTRSPSAQVDQIVAASNDLLMQKLWGRAAAFRRDDPMIAAVGASVDPPWSESDLDDLFRLAGSLD